MLLKTMNVLQPLMEVVVTETNMVQVLGNIEQVTLVCDGTAAP